MEPGGTAFPVFFVSGARQPVYVEVGELPVGELLAAYFDAVEPEASVEPLAKRAAPLDEAPVQPTAAAVATEAVLSQAMAAEPAPAAVAPPPKPPVKAPAPAPAASDAEWETF